MLRDAQERLLFFFSAENLNCKSVCLSFLDMHVFLPANREMNPDLLLLFDKAFTVSLKIMLPNAMQMQDSVNEPLQGQRDDVEHMLDRCQG